MANRLMPLARPCALLLVCAGCSANPDPHSSSVAGAPATGGEGSAAQPTGGKAGVSAAAGSAGALPASGGAPTAGGTANSAGNAGKLGSSESSAPPPAVDGRSVYALECHGDSKDCQSATVPCFGVSNQTPNVAAGWACANRCASDADCSHVPSGAEAQASCIPFTAAGHCLLVCQNEKQSFACPEGMTCHVPTKSAVGYCLWQ